MERARAQELSPNQKCQELEEELNQEGKVSRLESNIGGEPRKLCKHMERCRPRNTNECLIRS
eukprot:296488-Prorocentrum_lima.AAC.1